MSPLHHVLYAAKRLSDEGKKPTLALIKTKLEIAVAMPILIQGLQQYISMSDADKAALLPEDTNNAELTQQSIMLTDDQQKLTLLEQEVSTLKNELKAISQRLAALEAVSYSHENNT